MINRERGKRAERALSKKLGCKRLGILGEEDLQHPTFSFEVKSRKTFVAAKWYAQAIRNCSKGKTPAVIVHVHGKRHNDDFVIMRVSDFQDWLGKIIKIEGENIK